QSLSRQIAEKTAQREYLCVVLGNIKQDSGLVDAPIGRHKTQRKKMAVVPGGREARTNYTVVHRFGDMCLVRCCLETGRTHQIRVHMSHIGHPIVGPGLWAEKHAR
ncbi:MAG: RluA family pseudouridine synthase, partial [Christensenellales bacterium]